MAGDKPNPTQRPAPARGPGGGALQQRKRPARARLRLTRAFSVPCGDGVAPRARPETRAQPPSARRRGLTRHSHRYGERRPAPCSAARHPALLRRGDAGPQDWSDDRDAAASLSFLQFTVASMAWRWWRSHRHAIAAAIVLVMSVMFVGFVVLLHIYGKLTAVPDAVDEDPIMPETPGADA